MHILQSLLPTLNIVIFLSSYATTLPPSAFLNRFNSTIISSYLCIKHHHKNIKLDCTSQLDKAVKALTYTTDHELTYTENVVIIDQNNHVVCGHEKIAEALYKNSQVEVQQIETANDDLSEYIILKEKGLPEESLDWLLYEYIKLKDNCFIFVITEQTPLTQENILNEIDQLGGGVVYQKTIELKNFGFNALKRCLGYANLSAEKANPLKITIYVIESKTEKSFHIMQGEIHDYLAQTAGSYYSKNKSETIALAQLVFNKNSLHQANHSRANELPKFARLFSLYSKGIIKTEDCCVDNGSVLGTYGIREPGDWDYMHHGVANKPISREIGSHNWFYNGRYTKLTIDDIIYNPAYHFYYKGQKFMSLDLLTAIKKKKRVPKDIRDLRLIVKHLKAFQ